MFIGAFIRPITDVYFHYGTESLRPAKTLKLIPLSMLNIVESGSKSNQQHLRLYNLVRFGILDGTLI